MHPRCFVIAAMLQSGPFSDGLGGTTTGYGIVAMILLGLLVSAVIGTLVSLAFLAIRRGGHRGRPRWAREPARPISLWK